MSKYLWRNRLVFFTLQGKYALQDKSLRCPALFLLLSFIAGRELGLWSILIFLGLWASIRDFPWLFLIFASLCVGWNQQDLKYVSDQEWQAYTESTGFLRCEFKWLEDVYPAENRIAKGRAEITPIDLSGKARALTRTITLSRTMKNNEDILQLFRGVTWEGWIALRPKMSLFYMETGHAENVHISALMDFRRKIIFKLESGWNHSDSATRGFMRSLLTGNRHELADPLKKHFQRLGLMALLAISGLHLAIVYGLVEKLLHFFKPAKLIWGTLTGLLLVAIYASLGGWTAPLLRAFGMILFSKTSIGLGRRYRAWNALFFMAWIELIIHPEAWRGISFMLTYCGVAGILWSRDVTNWNQWPKRWYRPLLQSYAMSWGAMLWTWPITAAYFDSVPGWGWIWSPLFFLTFGLVMIYVLGLTFLNTFFYCPQPAYEFLHFYHHMLALCSQTGAWIFPLQSGNPQWLWIYFAALLGIWLIRQNREEELKN